VPISFLVAWYYHAIALELWSDEEYMKRRIAIVIGLAVVGVTPFCLLHLSSHKLILRAYFSDARNVRSGAAVRLAGVNVGTVKAVRIQPSIKDAPAELTMALDTGYDLRIPEDSVVVLQTAGVLGETYAEIEIAETSGPPVSTNAVLRSRQTDQLSLNQVIERLNAALKKCSDRQPTEGNPMPAKNGAGSANSRSVPSH
jgi:phospholipid/cholesterol/gamma-HCH transport system substrate-binding protein